MATPYFSTRYVNRVIQNRILSLDAPATHLRVSAPARPCLQEPSWPPPDFSLRARTRCVCCASPPKSLGAPENRGGPLRSLSLPRTQPRQMFVPARSAHPRGPHSYAE